MDRYRSLTWGTVCVALFLLFALAGCAGTTSSTGGTPASGGVTISEKGFAFDPTSAAVRVGGTVTFVNNDTVAHNVTIDGAELGVQNPGESKTWTAPRNGAFPFSCVIHPSMTGRITVGSGMMGGTAPSGGTGGNRAPSGGMGGGSAPPAGVPGY